MSKQSAVAQAARAAARLGAANDAVDAAAAAVLGVNRTDLRILGLVLDAGALAAGPLATAANLSPAATSTAIQRLVTAGYLSREVDSGDRRRAVVTVTPTAADLLHRVYGPIEGAGHRELARYTAAELAVILDFLHRGERMQLDQAARIRTMIPARRR
ncbi:MAG TPA: MarR family transcriptional regulator [Actinoplanes sp.]|nr:MarR family transcriptional regulator [Actinoplanes sp.]